MRRSVVAGLLAAVTLGCSGDDTPGAQSGLPSTGGVPARGATRAAPGAPGSTLTGTVREQIPVGPYVYLRLETERGEEWAAVNQAPVTEGDVVTVYNVMVMEQFPSQTLKRTFARISFGSLDPNAGAGTSAGAAAAVPGTPLPQPEAPDAMAGSPGTPAAADAKIGRIAKASGANAYTIGELFAKQRGLVGQAVSVRGVVVKYNPGVMGRNWVHLQDGTGTATNATHDLTVTSAGSAAVGDTVTVTGVVVTNKDYGAGYVYPLVLEDAKVVRR